MLQRTKFKVIKNLPFNMAEVVILCPCFRTILGVRASKWRRKRSLVSLNRLLSSSAENAAGSLANFLLSARQINLINPKAFSSLSRAHPLLWKILSEVKRVSFSSTLHSSEGTRSPQSHPNRVTEFPVMGERDNSSCQHQKLVNNKVYKRFYIVEH